MRSDLTYSYEICSFDLTAPSGILLPFDVSVIFVCSVEQLTFSIFDDQNCTLMQKDDNKLKFKMFTFMVQLRGSSINDDAQFWVILDPQNPIPLKARTLIIFQYSGKVNWGFPYKKSFDNWDIASFNQPSTCASMSKAVIPNRVPRHTMVPWAYAPGNR